MLVKNCDFPIKDGDFPVRKLLIYQFRVTSQEFLGKFPRFHGSSMVPIPKISTGAVLEAHVDVQRAWPRNRAREMPAAQMHQLISEAREAGTLLDFGRSLGMKFGEKSMENPWGKTSDIGNIEERYGTSPT